MLLLNVNEGMVTEPETTSSIKDAEVNQTVPPVIGVYVPTFCVNDMDEAKFTHAPPPPVTEPTREVLLPVQMVTSLPALALNVPVVTVTDAVEEQVPLDTVTV